MSIVVSCVPAQTSAQFTISNLDTTSLQKSISFVIYETGTWYSGTSHTISLLPGYSSVFQFNTSDLWVNETLTPLTNYTYQIKIFGGSGSWLPQEDELSSNFTTLAQISYNYTQSITTASNYAVVEITGFDITYPNKRIDKWLSSGEQSSQYYTISSSNSSAQVLFFNLSAGNYTYYLYIYSSNDGGLTYNISEGYIYGTFTITGSSVSNYTVQITPSTTSATIQIFNLDTTTNKTANISIENNNIIIAQYQQTILLGNSTWSYTISNLLPNTTYNYQITIYDSNITYTGTNSSGSFTTSSIVSNDGYCWICIYNSSTQSLEWKRAKPYIFVNNNWQPASPYIFDGTNWKSTTGV